MLLLGSTGSIGVQTLQAIEHLNALHASGTGAARYRVVGLAAGRNGERLAAQAEHFDVAPLALADAEAPWPSRRAIRRGADAATALVEQVEADIVLGAMVGFAGVPAMLAAVELGRTIALANKETLVAAGALITQASARSRARLLPVDSEHSGVWQCLACASQQPDAPPHALGAHVRRITLTASGGPLRTWDLQRMASATPEDALAHPTWNMGAKVTIDSASLTNKALELVEAHWLFGAAADCLDVIIHPQSIIHAFVELVDGSTLAQLGMPDMRTPIQVALTWPRRLPGLARPLDIATLAGMEFEAVDERRFPALACGYEVIRRGGGAGATFNAANERAVEAFLARRIPFGRIPELSCAALDATPTTSIRDLQDVLEADSAGRRFVDSLIGRGATAGGRAGAVPDTV